jgi:hypothetical protein
METEDAVDPAIALAEAEALAAEHAARKQASSAKFELWRAKFEEYARDNLKVEDPDRGLVSFEITDIQRTFIEIIKDIKKRGRRVRVMVGKARRVRISTLVAGRFFWKTTLNKNRRSLIVTHEPSATETLFDMHKRFYRHLPKNMTPQRRLNNRTVLDFNRPDGRKGGLDSSVRVGTAGKENFASSTLVHYLHLSEESKWPEHTAEKLLNSLLQCVPDDPDSEVIEESTAFGPGGVFYKRYNAARYVYRVFLDENGEIAFRQEINESADPSNIYSRMFFPFFVFKDYRMPLAQWERETGTPFVLNEKEENFIKIYLSGLRPEIAKQVMAWRRWTIEQKMNPQDGKTKEQMFSQEYPESEESMWVGSGSTAFDNPKILLLNAAAPKPIATYEINERTGQALYHPEGRLWVWDEPKPGEAYVVVGDPSAGKENDDDGPDVEKGSDPSAIDVFHQLSGMQCAQWLGRLEPDLFGMLMVALGNRYCGAWLCPESNNHGNTVIAQIRRMGYRKLYMERSIDHLNKPVKRFGFNTGGHRTADGKVGGSRVILIDNIAAALRDNRLGVRSTRTYDQMLSFSKDSKGRYSAVHGKHDETIFTLGIFLTIQKLLPLPSSQPQRELPITGNSKGLSGNTGSIRGGFIL